ncbi:MAG: hypothetical protein B9S32_03805 [Verrucomicrobia bacterium Tous-C9LFEB]|nr:MAG: hypothetical protein B9S32_03805 [Verrucomicrobia bacterium Tous-C9LFEB]
MPYTKIIPIRSVSAFRKLVNYLSNPDHPNHYDYDIEPLRCLSANLNVEEFLQKTLTAIRKIQPRQGGRRIKNIAYLHIIRTPCGTKLTPKERKYFIRNYVESEAIDANVLVTWHINRVIGCEDLNVIVPAVIDFEFPVLRRNRYINPIVEARETSDWITNMINAERRKHGKELIQTMPQRQLELAAERWGSSLDRELSQWPEPIGLSNIKEVIKKLGYRVPRFSLKKNYLSISRIVPDGKKTGRSIKFTISSLLAEIGRLRSASQKLSPEEQIERTIEAMNAQARRDASRCEIDRVLLPKFRRKKSSQDDPDL